MGIAALPAAVTPTPGIVVPGPATPLPPVVHQSPDQARAVMCSDRANPPAGADFPAQAALALALARSRSGEAGPYVARTGERCADRPVRDRTTDSLESDLADDS
ncbi:hypothetical protein ACFU7Y_32665 [Kitasatospora sp. NPDC057542]|uniref:hypothetical protein n=1 Tax=Streptomycetaceae TaxID=2062 RepID=UPI001CCC56E3|nr:hypothetical protein [Streptomyces sp. LS1784]